RSSTASKVHGSASWHGMTCEFAHRLHLLEASATSLLLVSCTHRCSGQGCPETFLLRFLIVLLSILCVNVIEKHHFNATIIQHRIQERVVHPLGCSLLGRFSRCTVFMINSMWYIVLNIWHGSSSHTIPSV